MRRQTRARCSRRGMSLVEVMVVIAIVLTLTALLTFGIWETVRKARVDTTWLTLGRVAQDVMVQEVRAGVAPRHLADVYGSEEIPVDAWQTPVALNPATAPGWEVVSWGEDGREGGAGYAADLRYRPDRGRRGRHGPGGPR